MKGEWLLVKYFKLILLKKKTYVEYEAGKNASYGLVARWAGCKGERRGIA